MTKIFRGNSESFIRGIAYAAIAIGLALTLAIAKAEEPAGEVPPDRTETPTEGTPTEGTPTDETSGDEQPKPTIDDVRVTARNFDLTIPAGRIRIDPEKSTKVVHRPSDFSGNLLGSPPIAVGYVLETSPGFEFAIQGRAMIEFQDINRFSPWRRLTVVEIGELAQNQPLTFVYRGATLFGWYRFTIFGYRKSEGAPLDEELMISNKFESCIETLPRTTQLESLEISRLASSVRRVTYMNPGATFIEFDVEIEYSLRLGEGGAFEDVEAYIFKRGETRANFGEIGFDSWRDFNPARNPEDSGWMLVENVFDGTRGVSGFRIEGPEAKFVKKIESNFPENVFPVEFEWDYRFDVCLGREPEEGEHTGDLEPDEFLYAVISMRLDDPKDYESASVQIHVPAPFRNAVEPTAFSAEER
ncbi:MAG: hypothetical protein NUW37_12430 [Planctomycetes bacterium]|nr:hypothetical protein [Planctomycetota bacterium]